MAGKAKKSKTNVSARLDAKGKSKICKYCGNTVEAVMMVTPTGKQKLTRKCCKEGE